MIDALLSLFSIINKTENNVSWHVNTQVAKQNMAIIDFDYKNIWHFAIVIIKFSWREYITIKDIWLW